MFNYVTRYELFFFLFASLFFLCVDREEDRRGERFFFAFALLLCAKYYYANLMLRVALLLRVFFGFFSLSLGGRLHFQRCVDFAFFTLFSFHSRTFRERDSRRGNKISRTKETQKKHENEKQNKREMR